VPQQHYFSPVPLVASHPTPVRVVLPDRTLELLSDRGVFAHGHLDRGTELLLRSVPPPPDGAQLLDLGCGYGPIAITMALRAPASTVWAVDINERARELTVRNAQGAGADNVTVAAPDAVPDDVMFAALYTNPPVRLGKAPLHALLQRWLRRLSPGGAGYLVVQRHLGADTLARWLEEAGCEVARLRSRQGYRLLQARPGGSNDHDGGRSAA